MDFSDSCIKSATQMKTVGKCREVTQNWGAPLSGSSSEEEMVSKYFGFILQIYFFPLLKIKCF